jgi:hypothetical protein
MSDIRPPRLRLFFDTDALLAGTASTRGAAHLLLRLAELGLVEVITCVYVREEAMRNVALKFPSAAPLLSRLLDQFVSLTETPADSGDIPAGVNPKDRPVWTAYRASGAPFLVTFNLRHYPSRAGIVTPGDVVKLIRSALVGLLPDRESSE